VDTSEVRLEDLVDLEHNENITEVHLSCVCDLPVNEVLQMLKRCMHLRRLTLKSMMRPVIPPSEELCDFIMELKHLTFLHIIYRHYSNCDHFKSLVDEVTAFVLPRRPKFEFYVSCCYKFDESRVSRPS
jgi:hypothetical protein